jgi:hypothetical protein
MSQTRAALDRKIALLESRARDMSPRRMWNRNKPDYLAERVIGGVLMLVGARMLWAQLRTHRIHRTRVRAAIQEYECW